MVVTGADRNFVLELAGRPALDRLDRADRATCRPTTGSCSPGGIHLGVVIDEARDDFGRGDFLVRGVMGADRANGVLAVGDEIAVGTTVQFHVRDADSADEDLHHVLARRPRRRRPRVHLHGAGRRTCSAIDDHDATVIGDHLDTDAVAGMFCAGELGPVGGRSFLHGFTASMLIFADD